MFEKEAEKYAENNAYRYASDYITCQEAYKDGAEFGYNKANEWHYPVKGDYPKECENVLCYCKVVDVKFCRIGHTIIGGDNKIRWWSNNRSEELEVYAWKEIALPKEMKRQVENRNCSNCRRSKAGCSNDGSCHNFSLWQPFINPQLTKAKEIIRDLLHCLPKENIEGVYEVTEEAEQFLKEIKEK